MPALSSYPLITNPVGYYVPLFTDASGGQNRRGLIQKLGLPYVLAQSAVAVSCTASTNEEALATITVPGGAIGAGGRLRIDTLWTMTNSANNKTTRTRFSAIGGTAFSAVVSTTIATLRDLRIIANRNSESSQVAATVALAGGIGGSANAVVTGAVVTSADTTLVITGQKASAGEVLTLEFYSVEVLYGA